MAKKNLDNVTRYVGIKYLAHYMSFKESTIRDWVRFRKIPFSRIGKGIRFDLKQIDAWLEEKQVEKK